jgi:hypothetical protein
MEGAARGARAISIASTLLLVGLGIGLSFVISKSITRPLAQLTRSVAQDSEPPVDAASDLSRIPEIRQLSDSLLHERGKLREVARSQAKFVDTVTEQVATPLMSIKIRLDQLRRHVADTVPHDQKTSVDIIIRETDRLIEHCRGLRKSPTGTLQPITNVHVLAANRNPSFVSPSVEGAFETESRFASTDTGPWNAGRHWANGALRPAIQRGRSFFARPWLAISGSINTLRGRKVKKQ